MNCYSSQYFFIQCVWLFPEQQPFFNNTYIIPSACFFFFRRNRNGGKLPAEQFIFIYFLCPASTFSYLLLLAFYLFAFFCLPLCAIRRIQSRRKCPGSLCPGTSLPCRTSVDQSLRRLRLFRIQITDIINCES